MSNNSNSSTPFTSDNNTSSANKRKKDIEQIIEKLQVKLIDVEIENEELKDAFARLDRFKQKYLDMFNFIPTGYAILDQKGRIIEINYALINMLDFSADPLKTPNLSQYVNSNDKKNWTEFINNIYSVEKKHSIEINLRKQDGTYFPAFIEGLITNKEDKEDNNFRISVTEILQYKQIEDELNKEKELSFITFQSSHEGIIVASNKGYIQDINPAAEKLLQSNLKEVFNRPLEETFRIVDENYLYKYPSLIETLHKKGQIHDSSNSLFLIRKDNSKININFSATTIHKNREIISIVVLFEDITEKIYIQNEINKIQNLETLAILTGAITHDFNNILTEIMGNIELVNVILDDPVKLQTDLDNTMNALQRAKILANQLLSFAKGGTANGILMTNKVIFDTARFIVKDTNVNCEFDLQENLWYTNINEAQLSKVINNMVINAKQAMPDGGIIKITAKNVTKEQEKSISIPQEFFVKITIEDEGMGIYEKELEFIFQPYYSIKQKGSGLGLANANTIINQQGGKIEVDSIIGKGTKFTIFLPAYPDVIKKKIIKETPPLEVEEVINQIKVSLVMDDDHYIRVITKKLLESLGHTVITTKNGEEAIKIYQEYLTKGTKFDVVFLDLIVPGGFGGIKTIDQLLKIDPELNAIVFSGYSNDPILANFEKYGFQYFLKKPFTKNDLKHALSKCQ